MVVAALVLAWPPAIPAQASQASLDAAQQERSEVQARLDAVLARLDELQAQTAQIQDRVDQLRGAAAGYAESAKRAERLQVARIRDVYKRGSVSVALTLFTAGQETDAAERARLLSLIALRHQADAEQAGTAKVRATATAQQVASAVEVLEAREAELAAARADAQAALEAAQAREASIREQIAAQQAARARAARQRAARQASTASTSTSTSGGGSTGGSGGGGGAPVSGGIACPIGTPRSYSDTYGAPRSGGRSHMGTDILSPHGTPIYAYESGTLTRLYGSSLGGISLYLKGDSGNLYYYTHLSGYASATRAGQRVSAGDHIAYNGDTGNAAGIPHLHFEVMPGGGSNVNPYPYVVRACG